VSTKYKPGYEPGDVLETYFTIGDRLYGYEVLDDDITIDARDSRYAYSWQEHECPRCHAYDTCYLKPNLYSFYSYICDFVVSGGWYCRDCGLVWHILEIGD
jgi:hypothetical protein